METVGDSSEYQGAEDSAGPEGSEQQAEAVGSVSEVLARDERKQRPQCHGRDDEHDRPQHDPPYDGLVPDVASSGAEGRHETFSARQFGVRAAPGKQCNGQEDHGGRIQGEDHRGTAKVSDDESSNGRSNGTRDIDAHQIEPGRRPEL